MNPIHTCFENRYTVCSACESVRDFEEGERIYRLEMQQIRTSGWKFFGLVVLVSLLISLAVRFL